MNIHEYQVRNAKPEEFAEIGRLMVPVYSQLDGFPKESDQPAYYNMLLNIGEFTKNPGTELLAAVSEEDKIAGAVVYISDMKYYGSGGSARRELKQLLTILCSVLLRENVLPLLRTDTVQDLWKRS